MKPILCLEFDGVVHSCISEWQGPDVVLDAPVDGILTFLMLALASFDVQIYTYARSKSQAGRDAMHDWLRTQAGAYWYSTPHGPGLGEIGFPETRPACYIGLTFLSEAVATTRSEFLVGEMSAAVQDDDIDIGMDVNKKLTKCSSMLAALAMLAGVIASQFDDWEQDRIDAILESFVFLIKQEARKNAKEEAEEKKTIQ